MRMPIVRNQRQNQDIRPIRTMFDDFLKNAFYQPDDNERMMAMDVIEKEKEYVLTANLPGIKKEDIKVYVDGNDFVIEAKRQEEKKEESEILYRSERYQGNYRRAFSIPETWNVDKVTAKFEDGVLHLNVPKKEAEPEKMITIS